jgi:hypothetical protein
MARAVATKGRIVDHGNRPAGALRGGTPDLGEKVGAVGGGDGEPLEAGEEAFALGDEELGLAGHAAEDDLARVQAGEGGDAPVVGMVDLDAVHAGDEPAGVVGVCVRVCVCVCVGVGVGVRGEGGVGVVGCVAAHAEGELVQAAEHARGDVVRDDGDVDAGALAEDEAGEGAGGGGAPAGLVGERVAEVEADGHGELERLERGEAVADLAEGGEVEGARAVEADAAEAGRVGVEQVVDEPVRPRLGDDGLGRLGVGVGGGVGGGGRVWGRAEEGVTGVDRAQVCEAGERVEELWVAVVVVLAVVDDEVPDVRQVGEEVDEHRVDTVRGRHVLLVLGIEHERAHVAAERRRIFETAAEPGQGEAGEIEGAEENLGGDVAEVPVEAGKEGPGVGMGVGRGAWGVGVGVSVSVGVGRCLGVSACGWCLVRSETETREKPTHRRMFANVARAIGSSGPRASPATYSTVSRCTSGARL